MNTDLLKTASLLVYRAEQVLADTKALRDAIANEADGTIVFPSKAAVIDPLEEVQRARDNLAREEEFEPANQDHAEEAGEEYSAVDEQALFEAYNVPISEALKKSPGGVKALSEFFGIEPDQLSLGAVAAQKDAVLNGIDVGTRIKNSIDRLLQQTEAYVKDNDIVFASEDYQAVLTAHYGPGDGEAQPDNEGGEEVVDAVDEEGGLENEESELEEDDLDAELAELEEDAEEAETSEEGMAALESFAEAKGVTWPVSDITGLRQLAAHVSRSYSGARAHIKEALVACGVTSLGGVADDKVGAVVTSLATHVSIKDLAA